MKRSKRPWTRLEKSLFGAPLVFVLAGGGIWMWRQATPLFIEVPDVYRFNSFDFSPDGGRIAFFYSSKKTFYGGQIYDLERRTKVCDLAIPSSRGSLRLNWPAWSPDGTRIIAGYNDGSVGTTKIIHPTRINKKDPGFHFNSVGKIAQWNASSGYLEHNYLSGPRNEDSYSTNVRYSSDGKTFVSEGAPPAIFDASTGRRLQVVRGSYADAYYGKRAANVGLWAVQSRNFTRLQVFDAQKKRVVWNAPQGLIETFWWCDDVLALVERDIRENSLGGGRLLLWDARTRHLLPSPPASDVGTFRFSLDKSTLAFSNRKLRSTGVSPPGVSQSTPSEIVVWNYQLQRVLWRYSGLNYAIGLRWSPDGRWLSAVVGRAASPKDHLLVFDKKGTLHIDREIQSDITCWAPDSTHLAVVSRSSNSPLRLEILRVDD